MTPDAHLRDRWSLDEPEAEVRNEFPEPEIDETRRAKNEELARLDTV